VLEVVRPDEPVRQAAAGSAARRGAVGLGARVEVFGERSGPGCAGPWLMIGPLSWICSEGAGPPGTAVVERAERPTTGGLPYDYYFVGRDGSFGYRKLDTAEEGVPDAQLQPGFGVALRLTRTRIGTSDAFGLTSQRLWVPLRDLSGPVRSLGSLGVALDDTLAVGWAIGDSVHVFSQPKIAKKTQEVLERLARVAILEERVEKRETWLRIGDDRWLRARDVAFPQRVPPPAEAREGERWIDVDLARQVMTAYVGARAVYAAPTSTGRGAPGTETATPPGVHRLWVKLAATDMDNLENLEAAENYAIQGVPWVQYFERGYGLHGAFWHRAFGRVQSHGCVNLSPGDAEWVFRWSSPRLPDGWTAVLPTDYEPGTIVNVH
jgi:hypothetical protein